jgi:radical SAM superfamily enzyme YgiQ (UPF0313 family)
MRTIDAVVAELKRYRENGIQRFFFVDNTFNLPADYARKLCEGIADARIDISWRAIFYPGPTDPALVHAMARAGCTEVSLGFESGSTPILSALGKRFTAEDVRRTSQILGDSGIFRMGFLLLGGPDETRDTVLESLHFAESLNLEAMKLTSGIRIYPHTRLADMARAEGMIDPTDNLLHPRFYIRHGMEAWLRKTVAEWCADRPSWRA